MAAIRLPSINRVVITGRLTQEPQLNYTASGTAVLKMRIASNKPYKGSDGEWKQEVCFLNIVAWSKLAENCGEYLGKGSAVYVEGRLKSNEWEDGEGNKKSSLDVHADSVQFLDKFRSNGESEEEGEGNEEKDDGLPF
jgi:single-strand DNA-binding protein